MNGELSTRDLILPEPLEELQGKLKIIAYGPFTLVIVGIVVSMILVTCGYWRKGTLLMGCDAIFAGIIRWCVPDSLAGLLMVSHRLRDTLMYLILGGLIVYMSLTINSLN